MFTQSINFYIEYCYIIKEYRCLKNVIYQLERNEWLVRSAFQQVSWQKFSFFCLKRETLLLRAFILKPTEKE